MTPNRFCTPLATRKQIIHHLNMVINKDINKAVRILPASLPPALRWTAPARTPAAWARGQWRTPARTKAASARPISARSWSRSGRTLGAGATKGTLACQSGGTRSAGSARRRKPRRRPERPTSLPLRPGDRKSTRLNSSHRSLSRMPSSA